MQITILPLSFDRISLLLYSKTFITGFKISELTNTFVPGLSGFLSSSPTGNLKMEKIDYAASGGASGYKPNYFNFN